jgi:hypothetical protein
MYATEALLAEYGKSISGSTFVIQVSSNKSLTSMYLVTYFSDGEKISMCHAIMQQFKSQNKFA